MYDNSFERMILRLGILVFWTLFWFFNVVDKFIGGAAFLFVGKDRFAQIAKFFLAIGIEHPSVALGALIIGTVLEIAAFVFLAGALFFFLSRHTERAQALFFWGTFSGLVLFSFFAVGDQIFGDRFELLEHTLFWVAIVVSWGIYVYFPKEGFLARGDEAGFSKIFLRTLVVILILGVVASVVIVSAGLRAHSNNPEIIAPVMVSEGIYRFTLPFLSTRGVWERSLAEFITTYPDLRITAIQNAPRELKSTADNAIFFVVTEPR